MSEHDPVQLMTATVARAAGALCAMVNVDVEPGEVRGADRPVAAAAMAVRLGLSGDLDAAVVLLVPDPGSLASLLGAPAHLAESAIAEAGNILGSHLLIGMEAEAGLSLSITPPEITTDAAEAAAWVDGERLAWVALESSSPVVLVLAM